MTTTDYKINAEGHLVPISLIKPEDNLRDQLVLGIVGKAKQTTDTLKAFKTTSMSEIETFMGLLAEAYGVKIGGKKGNVSLMSFDGTYKISRKIHDRLAFNEKLQLAKALIDACVKAWSEGSRPEIVVLVQDAFNVDKQGKISTDQVLGLRRLKITDPNWVKAMDLIGESVQVVSSKAYINVYERSDTGEYVLLPLDLAGV